MYLVYKNRFNVVKAYSVDIIAENVDYIDVFDISEDQIKTFKQSNVLAIKDSFEEAYNESLALQKNYEIIVRKSNPFKANWNNSDNKLEVCFTGFKKDEKNQLEESAKKNGLFLRRSVTQNLGLLVCGSRAGPKKIKVANKLNVPRVMGVDGFNNFLETGEFVE